MKSVNEVSLISKVILYFKVCRALPATPEARALHVRASPVSPLRVALHCVINPLFTTKLLNKTSR